MRDGEITIEMNSEQRSAHVMRDGQPVKITVDEALAMMDELLAKPKVGN